MRKVLPTKLQHIVLFTKDLIESHKWYRRVFDLQFSAQNDPDGSALMNLAKQSMHFFSFGYYHHDIALVDKKGVTPDNTSLLNYTMRLKDHISTADFIKRLEKEGVIYQHGRLLKSARTPDGLQAVCFKDPSGHWIEILGK